MRSIPFFVLLLLAISAQATTVVLDFDDLPATEPNSETALIEYRGFTFESTFGEFALGPFFGPEPALYGCAFPPCGAIMRDVNNNTFSLHSFEYTNTAIGTLSVTGTFAGGGTITEEFDYVTEGPAPLDWATAVLDSQWTNLESVEFSHQAWDGFYAGLDDIVVTAVPIPAAFWLFGSGIGLLGWFRREQTT